MIVVSSPGSTGFARASVERQAASTLPGGLHEQLGQPPAERGGVGQRAALGQDGLAVQQLRVAPEALVGRVGRVEGLRAASAAGATDSPRAPASPSARRCPLRRSSSSMCALRSPGSPTRQAGDEVSRSDSRTSLTSSWSAARSASEQVLEALADLLRDGAPPSSRPPRRRDRPRPGHRHERLALELAPHAQPQLVDRVQEEQHLVAARPERLQVRRALGRLPGRGGEVVDRGLPALHPRHVLAERGEGRARRWTRPAPAPGGGPAPPRGRAAPP